MSDIIDVQLALVAIAAAAVYPAGTGAASVSGSPIVIYPGWPTASRLDADLLVGKAHINVYPTQIENNKTRYSKEWTESSINAPGLTVAVVGQVITIGGAVPAPFEQNNVSVTVSGKAYVYAALANDTVASIAAAVAALIAADWPGTAAAGGIITLPGAASITDSMIGVTGTLRRELRRQQRVFQITVWANTPAQRDTISGALDVALADVQRLTMPDGLSARLIYMNSHVSDELQKAKLYRRDFQYSVEYATTQSMTATQITQTQVNTTISTTT